MCIRDREKPCIDREFPVIQRDAADCGAHLSEESFLSDFSNLDLYFKEVRFRLRFFSDCGYVRIKLRTLLKQYGYRRRSAKLLEHLEQCMAFYQLQPYLRGGIPCKLSAVSYTHLDVYKRQVIPSVIADLKGLPLCDPPFHQGILLLFDAVSFIGGDSYIMKRMVFSLEVVDFLLEQVGLEQMCIRDRSWPLA